MHVFVTGVGGFSGARLAENLVGRGWTVTGLTRNREGRLPALPKDRFRVMVSDAADLKSLPDNLDAVIHAAATMPFVGASDEKLIHDNVEGTRRLIDLSLRHKVGAFAFFSSTSVFGREHTGVLTDSSAVVEPEAYGRTKIECEKLLVEAAKELPSIAIRPPGIIGAGAGGNWVASVAARIMAGKDVTIFNADAAFNNCVHIGDLADLIVKLLERGFNGHEAAIVCAKGEIKIRDVVSILMNGLQRKVEVKETAPTRSPFMISSDKARKVWGWNPMTVEKSLARYAEEQRLHMISTST